MTKDRDLIAVGANLTVAPPIALIAVPSHQGVGLLFEVAPVAREPLVAEERQRVPGVVRGKRFRRTQDLAGDVPGGNAPERFDFPTGNLDQPRFGDGGPFHQINGVVSRQSGSRQRRGIDVVEPVLGKSAGEGSCFLMARRGQGLVFVVGVCVTNDVESHGLPFACCASTLLIRCGAESGYRRPAMPRSPRSPRGVRGVSRCDRPVSRSHLPGSWGAAAPNRATPR